MFINGLRNNKILEVLKEKFHKLPNVITISCDYKISCILFKDYLRHILVGMNSDEYKVKREKDIDSFFTDSGISTSLESTAKQFYSIVTELNKKDSTHIYVPSVNEINSITIKLNNISSTLKSSDNIKIIIEALNSL